MIKNPHTHLRISLLLTLAALAGACSLSQPYPAKQLYALDVPPPARSASKASAATLRVQPVRMTEPYDNEEFHYRAGAARIEADYYANFVDEPGRLITAELIEWLAKTQTYEAVVDASSTAEANRSVQLVINKFYADRSDAGQHEAVVAARVFLLDESRVETKVLLTRDYREAEPISGDGGDALVAAWGAALARIFEQLAADIHAAQ
jgi:ABC-type uncharacterized transport system auxiliary subunit